MHETIPQTTSFKLRGIWSLPGSNERATGDLVYDEDSLRLVLVGGLDTAVSTDPFSASPRQITLSVVHGTLVDKTPVTLLNCFYTSFRPDLDWKDFSFPKEVRQLESELHCGMAIIGGHLETENDEFTEGRVDVPQLEEWLGSSPFTVESDKHQNVDIKFRMPDDECFRTEEFELCLKHSVHVPPFPLGKQLSVEYSAYFVVAPFKKRTVGWFVDISAELCAFLSYLYGGNIQSRRLLLKPSASSDYLAVYYARHRVDDQPIEIYNIWTSYENLRREFHSLLNGWLSALDSHKRARRMLLANERRPSAYMELRFLPMVHALEVLTQSSTSAEIVPKEEYNRIKALVKGAIPLDTNDELKGAFMQSLRYANGKSLRFKIEQLIKTLSPTIVKLLCKDAADFAKGVVETRNFYTHYSIRKFILNGEELHWAARKISVLLRVLLLRSVGVSEETLQSILKTNMKVVNERRSWLDVSEVGTSEKTNQIEG